MVVVVRWTAGGISPNVHCQGDSQVSGYSPSDHPLCLSASPCRPAWSGGVTAQQFGVMATDPILRLPCLDSHPSAVRHAQPIPQWGAPMRGAVFSGAFRPVAQPRHRAPFWAAQLEAGGARRTPLCWCTLPRHSQRLATATVGASLVPGGDPYSGRRNSYQCRATFT